MSLERDQLNTDILLNILNAFNLNNALLRSSSSLITREDRMVNDIIESQSKAAIELKNKSLQLDKKEKSND